MPEQSPDAGDAARLTPDDPPGAGAAVPDIRPVFKEKDAAALETALSMLKVEIRFDGRAQRGELSHDGCQTWQPMTDRSTAALRRTIAEQFRYQPVARKPSPLKYGHADWTLYSNALLHERECDPFRDWLETLPEWDGKRRLDSLLGTVFILAGEGGPLAEWASRFILLGPVERAYEPGAKLDEMPVLIGPPGIGKSTALQGVLPPAYPEWFTDGLHLAASSKARAEALQGRVIVELAEMAGATRADIEGLKAFLSRTDDGGVRLSYRANPEPLPRRAILVGTADHAEPLPNDPNLRRFVPVTLRGGNPARLRDFLEANRPQLWAEALHRYRQKERARLPDRLKEQQKTATEAARQRDPILEDAVAAWVAKQKEPFQLAECAVGASLAPKETVAQLSKSLQGRLGRALRAQGFEKRRERSGGQRVWVWARKG